MARTLLSSIVIALFVISALVRFPGAAGSVYAIECSDYPNQQFAQLTLRVIPQDPHDLDGANDNGIACEELPCPCDTEVVQEAIGNRDGAASSESNPTSTAPAAPAITSAVTTTPPPVRTATLEATAAPAGSLSVITPPSTGSAGLH